MHRVEIPGAAALLLGCMVVGCGDKHSSQEDGDAASERDGAVLEDGSTDDADAETDALPALDGGSPDAGASADTGVNASDGSVSLEEGGRPSQFAGPPFARPPLPVQRLAMASNLGEAPVCVLLDDQGVYCADGYDQMSGYKDLSSIVPDNADYVWLAANEWEDDLFYGGRTDGSLRQWRYQTAVRSLSAGKYLGAFGDHFGMCGVREDGQLACEQAAVQALYPAGSYLQFYAGVQTVDMYLGLRSDGALVYGGINAPPAAPTPNVIDGDVFVATSARSDGSFCALSKAGTLSCMQNALNKSRVFRPQPHQNVRDFSEGEGHVCVVLADGSAACSLLDGSPSGSVVPKDKRFVDIETLSKAFTCGVTEAGELWCWQASGSAYQIALPKKAATR